MPVALFALIGLHAIVGAVVPYAARRWGVRTFFLAAAAPASAFIWLVLRVQTVRDGGAVTESLSWIPQLGVNVSLHMGLLQWVMALIVTGVGALVLLYCRWYFDGSARFTRCMSLLTWFCGTMLVLVTADDLMLLYVAWELTSVFSYLLIGHDSTRQANRGAALTALIVTTCGGLAMLTGIVMIWVHTGTLSLSRILQLAPSGPMMVGAVMLLLVGALSKSALVPFHFWLPGAMAAPTPVSAYLHAAAMVKAGVYLVAVLAPVFSGFSGWRLTVGLLGSATMLIGGWRSLRQVDLKLILAYGTVSQLGFLIVLTGLGTRSAALAGLTMVIAHALFKSALFLSVGIIDKTTGTRDLRQLSGLGRRLPGLALVFCLAAASMMGLPPLLGFVGKEAAFTALVALIERGDGVGLPPAVAIIECVALILGSVLTTAYTLRLVWGGLASKPDAEGALSEELAPVPRWTVQSRWMLFPPAVLALLGLALGLAAGPLDHLLAPYALQAPLGYADAHLALWHGWGIPLMASITAVAGGIALFIARDHVARVQATFPRVMAADEFYRRVLHFLERLSVETTSRLQAGSLPVYLSVILTVMILSVGTPLLLTRHWPEEIVVADNAAQVGVALMTAIAGFLAAASRGRMRAVMLVGVTGYGVALLFMIHGAPDLALTQVLVESVTLVVFVMLLRRMPRYFTSRPLADTRWWRILLAGTVGMVVMAGALVAPAARIAHPASEDLFTSASDFGYGRNIVNVILVDTRAWDTIGEIPVLIIAATGVASLIFLRSRHVKILDGHTVARTRSRSRRRSPELAHTGTWLRGSRSLSPAARSLLFEVVTRIIFGVMMVVSVWLLLRGHNAPGGGFAAGLVAGMALMTRYLAAGRSELDEAAPVDAGHLLGLGLFIAVTAAVTPVAFGGVVLQSFHLTLAVLGEEIHLVSSTLFDIGVYLVVVAVVLDYVRSLGAGIDAQTRARRAPVPRPDSTRAIAADDAAELGDSLEQGRAQTLQGESDGLMHDRASIDNHSQDSGHKRGAISGGSR